MAQMNISLPDKLKSWAEQRVAEGDYSSTSDYVRDLVRRDQARIEIEARETARLKQAWHEGLESGAPESMPDDWVEQVVRRGMERLAARSVPKTDAA